MLLVRWRDHLPTTLLLPGAARAGQSARSVCAVPEAAGARPRFRSGWLVWRYGEHLVWHARRAAPLWGRPRCTPGWPGGPPSYVVCRLRCRRWRTRMRVGVMPTVVARTMASAKRRGALTAGDALFCAAGRVG